MDTQPQIYVDVTYNVDDIALHTLLNRAGAAIVAFGEIFSAKRNISVPDSLSVKMLSVKF